MIVLGVSVRPWCDFQLPIRKRNVENVIFLPIRNVRLGKLGLSILEYGTHETIHGLLKIPKYKKKATS